MKKKYWQRKTFYSKPKNSIKIDNRIYIFKFKR